MNHVLTYVLRLDRRWLARAGAVGFWFFMVKGVMWLAAPLVFYYAL